MASGGGESGGLGEFLRRIEHGELNAALEAMKNGLGGKRDREGKGIVGVLASVCKRGRVDGEELVHILEKVLEEGADVSLVDGMGRTALVLAAETLMGADSGLLETQLGVFSRILGASVDCVEVQDGMGRTFMHWLVSAAKRSESVLGVLVSCCEGVGTRCVNAVTSSGETPLHWLAGSSGDFLDSPSSTILTKALLDAGASPSLKNSSGLIPKQILERSGHGAHLLPLLTPPAHSTTSTTPSHPSTTTTTTTTTRTASSSSFRSSRRPPAKRPKIAIKLKK